MELNEFVEIMEDIGFDLIKYFADVYYRQETGYPFTNNITNNKQMENTYSSCWYGGLFFEWLFPDNKIPTNKFHPWRLIHGNFSSDQECHYFFIITTDNEAIIFNTYGGLKYLIVNTLSLDEANILLERFLDNDVSSIEELFGITPDYDEMFIEEFTIEESFYRLPTKEELISKIDELINKAHTIEDSLEILKLKDFI